MPDWLQRHLFPLDRVDCKCCRTGCLDGGDIRDAEINGCPHDLVVVLPSLFVGGCVDDEPDLTVPHHVDDIR